MKWIGLVAILLCTNTWIKHFTTERGNSHGFYRIDDNTECQYFSIVYENLVIFGCLFLRAVFGESRSLLKYRNGNKNCQTSCLNTLKSLGEFVSPA